jgi:hypothetical protein
LRVITDPFEELENKDIRLKEEREKKIANREKRAQLMQASAGTTAATDEIGKYMNIPKKATSTKDSDAIDIDSLGSVSKKRKAGGGFGTFSNW